MLIHPDRIFHVVTGWFCSGGHPFSSFTNTWRNNVTFISCWVMLYKILAILYMVHLCNFWYHVIDMCATFISWYRTLDKTISSLEMQLAAARASKAYDADGSPAVTQSGSERLKERQKVFFVMGIITAFSSRKRRESIRETWMPRGSFKT